MNIIIILSAWSILWAGTALAEPSALVRGGPVNEATSVPTTIGVLRLHFDQNMDPTARTSCENDPGQLLASLGTGQDEQPAPAKKGRNPLGADAAVDSSKTGRDAQATTAKKARNPLGADAAGDRQPAAASGSKVGRPPCPQGWTDLKNPTIGMQAYVPSDYWVRLRGGLMLTVEKQDSPATVAFMVPMRPRAGAKAADIAQHFATFAAQAQPRFQAQIVGEPSADLARSRFKSLSAGQPVEGKYCTILAAGGTMAYVIGISAPQGRLEQERPKLEQIAQGFGFVPPRGKWLNYQSPAGGFTMTMPQGWQVESGDGRSSKDNIDWVARDPQKPLSRVFQWCPRYCSPQLLQDPLHAMRGYQAAQFQSHQQVILTSLAQLSQNPKLLKVNVNQELTRLCQDLTRQTGQLLAALNVARTDVTVYDCLAQAEVDGRPVIVAFITVVQTMVISGGLGQLTDLSVTLRGWCAEPNQFVIDTPVLEKVCASMELTPAFLRKIVKGNEQAVNKIRETYDYMNKVDDQIRQNHWDTMDAIAEMNYDTLRDSGGYVNEKTGRIEQIPFERLVKNSRGDLVSAEEVNRGVSSENATVLRGAYSDDYLRGVYGRTTFSY